MITKIREFLLTPFRWIKQEIAYRKRIKKLRKNDPFIYR